MKNIKNNIDKFSVIYYTIVLMLICNSIAYFITEYSGIVNEDNEALAGALINFFAYLTIVPIIFLNRSYIKEGYKQVKDSNLIKFILVIFLCYVVLTIFNAISTNIISSIVDNSNSNQDSLDSSSSGGILAILVIVPTMVLLGPLVEELIFRKAVFNLISNKKLAVAVSLVGFGFIHVIQSLIYQDFQGMIYIFQYALMGSVLVFVYLKNDKNIAYPLTVHIFNNSITAIAIVIAFINK